MSDHLSRGGGRGGRLAAIHLLLFFSGALALVYELLWLRWFTDIFGATTPATAVTLAAVLLGFTVGSAALGARAARWARPIRAYGALEAAAGLSALAGAWLIGFYERHYFSIAQNLTSPVALTALKSLLALAALFPATFCMGGTVPLLGHATADERRRLGISAGSLYALNTAGAAVGALSVPFFWLPRFGAVVSYRVCVGASLLIGVVAWILDRRSAATPGRDRFITRGAEPTRARAVAPSAIHGERRRSLPNWQALGVAGLSGALLLTLEVAWGRMFAQAHENSIYSFAIVLALFLAGLAGASALARTGLGRGWDARNLLIGGWLAGGVAVIASPWLFYRLTHGLAYLGAERTWAAQGIKLLWLAAPTVLAPTLLAGLALPALMDLGGAIGQRPPGRVLGGLLAVNTAGSLLGSLAAAFLFPGWLGLWWTIAGAGAVMAATGAWLWWAGDPRRAGRPALALALTAVAALAVNPSRLPRVRFAPAQGERLLTLTEDSYAITAVIERRGERRVKLDNYYLLGGTASAGDERMQGHLPLLLHPAPKRVAFLGLGTGITAGAAMLHPVEQVTAVELVPGVVAAATDYFGAANLGLLAAPRTRVVAADARHFLRGTAEKFDVIVGDLVVPWRRGEAALYLADHFQAGRRALAPGGLFCQWLPLFQLSEAEFNIVAATFLDVFPNATLWRGDYAPDRPAVALIGGGDELRFDPAVVARRVGEARPDPLNPQLAHAAGVWMFLAGPLDARQPRFTGARRNRADQPWLELMGPPARVAGEDAAFTGERLEAFLAQARQTTHSNGPLAGLGPAELRWRDAGGRIGTATLDLWNRGSAGGPGALRDAVAGLPPEVQIAVLGPGGAASPANGSPR